MKNDKKIRLLLTPSWIVNFVGLSLGILATGAVIVLARYQSSDLRSQVFEVQASRDNSSAAYQNLTDFIANNHVLGAAPLLILWACVGLVVYYFALAIARSFGNAVNLHDQLKYVHVSRQQLVREALQKLGIRVAAVAGWFIFIKLTLSIFWPYALTAAYVASESLSLQSVGYVLLAVLVIYLTVWGHAIFLRLIAQKSRLFSS